MSTGRESATETSIVSRDRAIDVIRRELRTALYVEKRFASVKELSLATGVPPRAITTYVANDEGEKREPPLSAALSIAVVLGPRCVNAILALVGYGGAEPLDEPDGAEPMSLAAEMMTEVAIIANAAARGRSRISHLDKPAVEEAANRLVHDALKLSSIAEAE